MRKGIGTTLIVLGVLFMASASTNAKEAPNCAYLIGTYLHGIILIAVGAGLRRTQKSPEDTETEHPLLLLQARRGTHAEMGILGGIVLMFMGGGLSQQAREVFPFATAILLGGWGLMIWGAANYMKWKGYSGWFGLLGLLLLPGLIILACFPNRMKDLNGLLQTEARMTLPALAIVLAAVLLLIVLPVVAFLTLPWTLPKSLLGQSPCVWATLASDPPKFTIEMPANPKRQIMTQEGPQGEVRTTIYESCDGIITYAACLLPRVPTLNNGMPREQIEAMLDMGLDETANQLKGRVLQRRSISLGNHYGREQTIEFLPGIEDHAGQPVVSCGVYRIYFTGDSVIAVSVSLPKYEKDLPETGKGIARFFDSLKVDENATPEGHPGE